MSASSDHEHPVDPERVARARARMPSLEGTQRLASVLGMLADPARARVLYALDLVEELCVGDLVLATGMSESAVGYALRLLRTAGLIANRKEGRVVYYCLANGFPKPLMEHCLWRIVDLSRTQDPLVSTDELSGGG